MNVPNKYCEDTSDFEEFLRGLEDDVSPDHPNPHKVESDPRADKDDDKKVTIEYFRGYRAPLTGLRKRYQ